MNDTHKDMKFSQLEVSSKCAISQFVMIQLFNPTSWTDKTSKNMVGVSRGFGNLYLTDKYGQNVTSARTIGAPPVINLRTFNW